MRIHFSKTLQILCIFIFSLSLCACMETASDLSLSREKPQINAPPIPVSLISLEGAPDNITALFNTKLKEEAAKRDIHLVLDTAQPRFKLKGYLSAYSSENSTTISWVWDIYDTRLEHTQRIDGEVQIKQTNADAWNLADDATLKTAASNAMNEIASYLSTAKLPPKITPRIAPKPPVINPNLAAISPSSKRQISALDF